MGCANRSHGPWCTILTTSFQCFTLLLFGGTIQVWQGLLLSVFPMLSDALYPTIHTIDLHFGCTLRFTWTACKEISHNLETLFPLLLSHVLRSNICHKSSQISPSLSHKLKRHTAIPKLCESQIKHFH